jgi:membrane fusion protein (multidrug efflux system)
VCLGWLRAPIAIALALVTSAACQRQEQPVAAQSAGNAPPVEVTVATISPQTLPVTFDAVGQTAGSREVEIRARVGGILLERRYREGAFVERGTVLFKIDPAPFEAALKKAEGLLAQEEAQLARATQDLARMQKLVEQGFVARKDYDDAFAAREAARARVQSARAGVTEARLNLGYTTVEAPISGVTGRAEKSEGSLVAAGTDLLSRVSQIEPIYVNFSYSETDLLRVRNEIAAGQLVLPGNDQMEVELRLADGSTYPETGRLNFNDLRVRAGTGTIESRAVFPNEKRRLLPGQFVRVLIKGATRPDAIVVPQAAVMTGAKGKFVYVVDQQSRAEMRPVETGAWEGDEFLVTAGLQPNDRVVVNGAARLQPGMRVAASPAAEPAASVSGTAPDGAAPARAR